MNALLELRPHILERASALWGRWRKPAERFLQLAFPAVLLTLIAHSLYKIGLVRVWSARPASTAFYLLLFVPFFLPSFGDLLIFRRLLRTDKLPYIVFLRKQCLNSVVLDLSGDAYFFLWCRRNLGQPNSAILHAVKDSNILSGAASLVILCITLALLAASGTLMSAQLASRSYWALLSLGIVPVALTLALVIGGRRVTALSRRDIAVTFLIHQTRALVVLTLQLLTWYVSGALPSVIACVEFVALGMLVSRLPILPNKALIYAGTAIVAAGILHIPQSGVAAAVVFLAGAGQLASATIVALPWLVDQLGIKALHGARLSEDQE